MKVQDLMRSSPKCCESSTNLAAAVEMLWCGGCGALPVVDANRRVIGIITDRDICLAVGTQNRRPSEVMAAQAMSHRPITCSAADDIHDALRIMRDRKVRRLPVVDESGQIAGILSLSDLILEARHDDGSRPALTYEDVMGVLKSVYWAHSFFCGERTVCGCRS